MWHDLCLRRWPDDDDEAWLLPAQAVYTFAELPTQTVAFWMIRCQDLAKRNFENVKFVMHSYM